MSEDIEQLKQKEASLVAQTQSQTQSQSKSQVKSSMNLVNNYQYTSDIIFLWHNLNNKYRYDAYESLGFIKEIKNMTIEFKIKLLFSVVVVSKTHNNDPHMKVI